MHAPFSPLPPFPQDDGTLEGIVEVEGDRLTDGSTEGNELTEGANERLGLLEGAELAVGEELLVDLHDPFPTFFACFPLPCFPFPVQEGTGDGIPDSVSVGISLGRSELLIDRRDGAMLG